MKSTSETNFSRALANLGRSLSAPVTEPRDLSGIIKDFEMAYELSWKVLKKRLLAQGAQTQGPKDVYTQAYKLGLIQDEATWLSMIDDRNQAAHVYDEKEARKIVDRIKSKYIGILKKL